MSQTTAPADAGAESRALWGSTMAVIVCFAVWTVFSIIGVQIKEELGLNDTQSGLLLGTPILTGSRTDPAIITSAEPGELSVIRNVAAPVPVHVPDGRPHGTASAIEFGVKGLGVRHIIVLGHSFCAGVRCLLKHDHGAGRFEFVSEWVEVARDVRDEMDGLVTKAERGLIARRAEQAAVLASLRHLATYPFIAERVAGAARRGCRRSPRPARQCGPPRAWAHGWCCSCSTHPRWGFRRCLRFRDRPAAPVGAARAPPVPDGPITARRLARRGRPRRRPLHRPRYGTPAPRPLRGACAPIIEAPGSQSSTKEGFHPSALAPEARQGGVRRIQVDQRCSRKRESRTAAWLVDPSERHVRRDESRSDSASCLRTSALAA